jgi:competence protein ComEA
VVVVPPVSSTLRPAPPGRSEAAETPAFEGRSARLEKILGQRSTVIRTVAVCLCLVAVAVAIGSRLIGNENAPPDVSVIDALPRVNATLTGEAGKKFIDPSATGVSSDLKTGSVQRVDPAALTAPSTTEPDLIVVHAAGAVVRPGVYVFGPGARAADLVIAAGGLTPDADADRINLASGLVDSSRVFVPRKGQVVPSVVENVSASGADSTQGSLGGQPVITALEKLDLNTATAEQLDRLPGVGPATAAAILEHRAKIGRFRSISQLMDVPGIGEAKLSLLRAKVMV